MKPGNLGPRTVKTVRITPSSTVASGFEGGFAHVAQGGHKSVHVSTSTFSSLPMTGGPHFYSPTAAPPLPLPPPPNASRWPAWPSTPLPISASRRPLRPPALASGPSSSSPAPAPARSQRRAQTGGPRLGSAADTARELRGDERTRPPEARMSSAAAGGARDAVARGAYRRGGPRLSSAADAAHELRGDEGARELCRCPSPSTLAS